MEINVNILVLNFEITGGPICYRINGSCVEGCITSGNFSDDKCTECKDGYYNRTGGCTELCPENCDGICDKDNGFCHGCKSGYFAKVIANKLQANAMNAITLIIKIYPMIKDALDALIIVLNVHIF